MKKNFRLSNQAITLLKQPELKLQLMLFFEVNDPRTIESYFRKNVPNGPLMNICIRELIYEYAPFLNERDIYCKLTESELNSINKTKLKLKCMHNEEKRKKQEEWL